MNTLTYTLRLNDNMSSTLKRIGVSSDSTKQDVRELKGEVNSLNRVKLSGFLSSLGRIATVLGVGTVLGKTIRMGMEQEMRNTSFEVLFGGAENAKKMIDDISLYAAKSSYGKAGLSEATQIMAGFGIAQDKIMPNLRMIGDIAMGDATKFNSLTLAFSQMSSAGKLTGQDLLQMINTGFNPLEQMSWTTGKSIAQLKDEMSKGAISSDMVAKAFYDATAEGGRYNGMIEKISSTVGGQWATVQDNLSEKLLNLYNNVLQPILLPALQFLNQFLENPINTITRLVDRVTSAYPVISAVIIGITAAIAAYNIVVKSSAIITSVVTVATKIWTAAQTILNAVMTANPVGLTIAGIVALIAVIAFLVIKIDGWGKMWDHTVNGAKLIFQAFTESIKWYFNTMIDGLMIGLNYIKKGWYSFKEAVGLGDSSENQRMLAQINADTEARKQSIIGGAQKVAELNSTAMNEFKQAANSLSWNDTSFSDVTSGIKNKLGISSPGVPGTSGSGIGGLSTATSGGAGRTVGKETANSIATGGTKTTHITINMSELVGTININKNGFRESAANMRDIVLDEMTRVLSMAQGQAI